MKRIMLLACVTVFIVGCTDYFSYKDLARTAFCSGYRSAFIACRNGDLANDMNDNMVNALAIVAFNELMEK